MKMTIKIDCDSDNAAFDDSPFPELARILHGLADRLEHAPDSGGQLYDINGNTVGEFALSGKR